MIVDHLIDLQRLTLASTHVCVDVRLYDYDRASQTVSIEPVVPDWVQGDDGERVEVPVARITGRPVRWLSAGGRTLTAGIEDGQLGLAIIRDRSHEQADRGVGGLPVSSRRHALEDAVVLPLASDAETRSDGQLLVDLPAGQAMHVGGGASEGVARGAATDDRLATLRGHLDTAGALGAWLTSLAGAAGFLVPLPPAPPLAKVESDRLTVDG